MVPYAQLVGLEHYAGIEYFKNLAFVEVTLKQSEVEGMTYSYTLDMRKKLFLLFIMTLDSRKQIFVNLFTKEQLENPLYA